MSIFKQIKNLLAALLGGHAGLLLFSICILLMLYGYHGNLDLLQYVLKDWSYPGTDPSARTPIIPWIPWDREFISFFGGFVLLVVIPCIIIKWVFRENLSDYGLRWPAKDKRAQSLVLLLTLVVGSAVPFYFGARDPAMQAIYPFYKSFSGLPQFIIYELSYFPFFFVIEFVFRGALLFGAARALEGKNADANAGPVAIVIAMLPYCAWHLGKPLTELWGTPVWGLLAGAGVYYTRSIWPVLMAHWLLNVWLDGWILHNCGLAPFN